jgi:hypothetical protein
MSSSQNVTMEMCELIAHVDGRGHLIIFSTLPGTARQVIFYEDDISTFFYKFLIIFKEDERIDM